MKGEPKSRGELLLSMLFSFIGIILLATFIGIIGCPCGPLPTPTATATRGPCPGYPWALPYHPTTVPPAPEAAAVPY